MEKVNKVSISGISFTLEEEALKLLSSYLDTLNDHYQGNPNGSEILEGIEERIAELLIDKGGKNAVISASMAREVIDIIGKPEQIIGDSEDPGQCGNEPEATVKKRLYRNPYDKKISGVCGGLGAFFKIDPLWFRIGFLVLFFLSAATADDLWNPSIFAILYIILWICMPLASTTRQKSEMLGKSLSYNDIEREVENRKLYEENRRDPSSFLSVLLKIVGIFLGFILVIIGISGIIAFISVTFGLSVAGLAIPSVFTNLLAGAMGIPEWLAILIKVLAILAVSLPFIGLLYCGIALIFRFKTPVWKPGLLMLLIWFVSLIGLGTITLTQSVPYWETKRVGRSISLDNVGDTLHIKFTDIDKWKEEKVFMKGSHDEYFLAYLNDRDRHSPKLATYPDIDIDRSDSEKSVELSFDSFFGNIDLKKDFQTKYCQVSSDTLYISPVVYGRGNEFENIKFSLDLNLPDDVKVIIEEPFAHDFKENVAYTNIKGGFLTRALLKHLLDDY